MGEEICDKFNDLERLSLSNLIDKLSLIGHLEYFSLDHNLMIKKAKEINPKIKDLGSLNRYYVCLKKEIDAREKAYLTEDKLIKLIQEKMPSFFKYLKEKF